MKKLIPHILILAFFLGCGLAETATGKILIQDGDTIAFLGDSITNAGASYGGFCRLVIQGLKSKGIRTRPILAGVPGDTSANMLLRLDRSVLDYKPDWVFLAAGVNDIWHHDPTVKIGAFQAKPGMGVGLEDYKGYVRRIVDRCEAAGAKVILSTITPIKEDPDFKLNRTSARYNQFLYTLAKERQLPIAQLNEAMFARIAEARNARQAIRLTSDGVHPTRAGHYVMAKGILKAMGFTDDDLALAEKQWNESPRMLILGDRQVAAGGRTGGWCHMLMDGMNRGRQMVTYRSIKRFTAEQLLDDFRRRLTEDKPRYVLLVSPRQDALAATPLSKYRKTVATLIELAEKEGVKPVIATIPAQNDLAASPISRKIKTYNDVLRDVAASMHCALADVHAAMAKWYAKHPNDKLTLDGERFNHPGGVLMARTVLRALGYGQDAIDPLRKIWDARPSYTFLGSYRVKLKINLSKRGYEVLDEIGRRYHKIDTGRIFQLGLYMLFTKDSEQNRRRIAAFDRQWTTAKPDPTEPPYQQAIRMTFSWNQVQALQDMAAKQGIDIQEVFSRAFKIGVHAMRNDDLLGRGKF